MLNNSNNYFKGFILVLLLINCFAYGTAAKADVSAFTKQKQTTQQQSQNTQKSQKTQEQQESQQPQQQFQNDSAALQAKTEAFATNAESFKKFIANVQPSNIDKEQAHMFQMIDSMLNNNKELQDLTKKIADNQETDQQKSFYTRSILPNLQNVNRQLSRIKDSVDKDQINYKNLKWQSERVEESIKQVVDRLKSNAN